MRLHLSPVRNARWLAAAARHRAGLAACAVAVKRQTERAERAFPPKGRFVVVDGVRLHFTVYGRDDAAQTVVLLHGNGTMAEEFDISGSRARPPSATGWSSSTARLRLERAARGTQLGPRAAGRAAARGARAPGRVRPDRAGPRLGRAGRARLGLRIRATSAAWCSPRATTFPTLRLDVPLRAAAAVPGVGRLLAHTVAPLLARLLWPARVRRMFAPAPPTAAFAKRYPVGMSLRPGQLRASAAESAMLVPAASALRRRYAALEVPAVLVAGRARPAAQHALAVGRLHDRLGHSWLRVVEGSGHMVHHVATGQVMAAVDQAAAIVWDRSLLLRPPLD
jgi:hypothetical protein